MNGQLMTITELAEAHKISRATLYNWRSKGWLKATAKAGKSERYTEDDFWKACDETLKAQSQTDVAPKVRKASKQKAMRTTIIGAFDSIEQN